MNPILNPFDVLPFIDKGYKYDLIADGSLATLMGAASSGASITLSKGVSKTLQIEDSGKPQMLIEIGAIFDSPYGTLEFVLDDWKFTASPYQLTLFEVNQTTNFVIRNLVYKPMSPYGPLYGMVLDVAQPLPISKNFSLRVSNPSASLKSSIECLVIAYGRIIIDEMDKDFMPEYRALMRKLGGEA